MSLGDADAKFPHSQNNGIPPSPSRENPGQVYPKSDPTPVPKEEIPGTGGAYQNPASVLSNPFMFEKTMDRLDSALTAAIDEIASEEQSFGESSKEAGLLAKFRQWRDEVAAIKSGGTLRARKVAVDNVGGAGGDPQKGSGLFTD